MSLGVRDAVKRTSKEHATGEDAMRFEGIDIADKRGQIEVAATSWLVSTGRHGRYLHLLY